MPQHHVPASRNVIRPGPRYRASMLELTAEIQGWLGNARTVSGLWVAVWRDAVPVLQTAGVTVGSSPTARGAVERCGGGGSAGSSRGRA
jgi:hypothetical protein